MIETRTIASTYHRDKEPHLCIHDTEHLTHTAKMAIVFVERWGMVQGIDNGEDTAGRAKIGLMSVDATIDRALEMAEKLAKRLRDRGHVTHLPTLAEMDELVKETEPA